MIFALFFISAAVMSPVVRAEGEEIGRRVLSFQGQPVVDIILNAKEGKLSLDTNDLQYYPPEASITLNKLYDQISQAILKGDSDTFEKLIQEKVEWSTGPMGFKFLRHACQFGRIEIVKYLLDHGASPNVDRKAATPLHCVCSDPNFLETRVNSPSSGVRVEIIELLLRKGANVNARDIDDKTPLHYLVSIGGMMTGDIQTVLLKNGTDPDAVDINQCTARDVLLKCHKSSLASLLADGLAIASKEKRGFLRNFFRY